MTFKTGVFSPDNKMVFVGAKTGDLFIWEWESGKLLRKFNHTGKKIETVSWHPSGDYLAFAGYDSYIRLYRVKDVLTSYKRSHEIPVAHKSWAGDHAEYIDFNADGTFLVSAHQSGLIKLWSFMGEDYGLTGRLHKKLVKEQKAIMESKRN